MLSLIATGFAEIMNPLCIALIAGGVLLGIVFGSIPGLSATMAVALCLPMTYGMEPINGMALLLGLYIGGISGGLVAAILLRTPHACLRGHLPRRLSAGGERPGWQSPWRRYFLLLPGHADRSCGADVRGALPGPVCPEVQLL